MVDAIAAVPNESLADHFGRQVLHWIVGYSTAWYATLSHCDLVDNLKKVDSGAKILLQGLGVKTNDDDDDDEEDDADVDEEYADEANGEDEAGVGRQGGRLAAEGNDGGRRLVGGPVRRRRKVRRAAARGYVNRYDPLVEYDERNYENLMLADLMENCDGGIPDPI
uniref:Uncharacterized protein n=1 Tax=Anopheles atroparvus TaxID=41427 RepID=A0A182JBS2_ANOAO